MAGILKVDQYQDFNGNNIMTSDGAGNLTINNAALKNTPAFLAYLCANQTVSDGQKQLLFLIQKFMILIMHIYINR